MTRSLNSRIAAHLSAISEAQLEEWSRDYRANQMVVLRDVLPKNIEQAFVSEARDLLANAGQRRELNVEESGNTPRAYNSVGRDQIRAQGKLIPTIFDSEALLEVISKIADEQLHRVPYAPEEFIINSQHKPRDTHGWHWDDYAFALIWCIDEPDPISGGRIEFIPRVEWQKDRTRDYLRETLRTNAVQSIHLKTGECYLMKANTCLHRISPLSDETRRTVVVMTYASASDLTDQTITHKSMEGIYPDDTSSLIVGAPV